MHNTLDLKSKNEKDILRAGDILKHGGLVAIPTETVYGLAADATNEEAVKQIFVAKGRPQDNPLIVHISEMSEIYALVKEVPQAAVLLAEHFWPGPLTIIMKKSDAIPAITSANLDSVGIRMPEHAAARAVIKASGVPLAAPSANTSGKPSPTTAQHVRDDMEGKIDAILDGGACDVGVESTVVDATCTPVRVLRPGAITVEQIAAVLGEATVDKAVFGEVSPGEIVRAPGMKYRHYAPKAEVLLFSGAPSKTNDAILDNLCEDDGVLCFDEYKNCYEDSGAIVHTYGSYRDKQAQGRLLFSSLRAFDKTDCKRILAQAPRPFGEGFAVANRINKAAGFHVKSVDTARVIGVTGASGSGKSTVAKCLTKMGWHIINADEVYHQLLTCDCALRKNLLQHFPDAWAANGIDRSVLAAVAFANANSLLTLNAITHPSVRAEILRRIKVLKTQKITKIVIDAPLLFESNLDMDCQFVIGVTVPRTEAICRIMKRDEITIEQAHMRLDSQPRDAFYRKYADIIIENAGTEAELQSTLENELEAIKAK